MSIEKIQIIMQFLYAGSKAGKIRKKCALNVIQGFRLRKFGGAGLLSRAVCDIMKKTF